MHTNSTAAALSGKADPTPAPYGKPGKPHPDFPLFPHANGQWCKKIRGMLNYFGLWDDPDGALAKYLDQKDDLIAGRKPRIEADAFTIKDLVNAFLNHKAERRDSGEITSRTWQDYKDAIDLIVTHLGKNTLVSIIDPEHFAKLRRKLTDKWGPCRVTNVIVRIRAVFKHAIDNGLIDRPVTFGSSFQRPSKKTIRIERAKKGLNLFTREELHAILNATDGQLRAMILLGVNMGFNNSDCGTLPTSAIDHDGGWVAYARPKTGISRRAPLWPETAEALRAVIETRPEPLDPDDAGLVFITKYGRPWFKDTPDSPVAKEMAKVLQSLKINSQKGRGFGTLRHVFRTVADETLDRAAIDIVMGHSDPTIASHYRERVDDSRLRRVVEHVHTWLFGAN